MNDKFRAEFENCINELKPQSVLFVSSREYDRFCYRGLLESMGVKVTAFTAFEPCPETSSVLNGVETFKDINCDLIVTVGGGSTIDCAKGIKFYAESDVKILAVPTTAGTGAEVTKTSVLYNGGDKKSVKDVSLIPEYAVFDYTTLETLPRFQKIVTAYDAFCHSFEAYLSRNATEESQRYSVESLELFAKYFENYIDGDESTYEPMMKCSELAGRAINIAATAAPHQFSYKLHKLLGFAHGQACVVCLVYIWKYMSDNSNDSELTEKLDFLESLTGYTPESLKSRIKELGLLPEITMTDEEFAETVDGVDLQRISNNPMILDIDDVRNIYNMFIKVE